MIGHAVGPRSRPRGPVGHAEPSRGRGVRLTCGVV